MDTLIDNLEETWLASEDDIPCEGAAHECDSPAVYTAIWSACCPNQRRRNNYCEPCFNAWLDPDEGERIAVCIHCDEEIVMERYFRIK